MHLLSRPQKSAPLRTSLLVLLAFLVALLMPGRAVDDFERHIDKLTKGAQPQEIKTALAALESAGVAAFPSLVAHLNDTRPAEANHFQQGELVFLPDGTSRAHESSVGEACYSILQTQLVGNLPKGFRHYTVLTPENIRSWLAERPGFTLAQLRRSARAAALSRAEAELAKDPTSAWQQKCVAYLRDELAAVKE